MIFTDWLFLVGSIVLIALTALFIAEEYLHKKRDHRQRLPLSFTVMGILFFYLIMVLFPYTINSPVNSLTIVITTALATVGTGFLGVFLYFFRELKLFEIIRKITRKEALTRFGMLLMFYLLCSFLIGKGIIFLFNGLISVQSVTLTPEFELYAVPTMSVIVLFIFRLTRLFSTKAIKLIGEVSKDAVIFSLLMYWIGIVASSVGIPIQIELTNIISSYNGLAYLLLVILGISIEGLVVWIATDSRKHRPDFSMENLVASYSKAFRAKEQTTLDDFKSPNFEPKKEVKKPLVYEMFETHGIHYRGKFLKASRIALVVILLLELLLVSGIITTQIPKSQLVVAPAYFTDVQILPKDQLPANIEFTFSEDMESISVNKSYAIPIVRVQTSNISFLAPISHRLVSLNSSNYIVSETSDYLSFNLKKCYIEITLSGSSFGNISYHQENNACFDYIGFSRDAEILYELAQFGYNQTIIFSDSSAQGLDQTTQQKLFFSDGENSSNVLITINKVRPLTDTTSIYSDNQAFTNQTTFLIQQTKVVTTIANDSTIPQIPFRVVISDG